jgi:hypothetical protein
MIRRLMPHYTVVWWEGGAAHGRWMRTELVPADKATRLAAQLMRGGRAAMVWEAHVDLPTEPPDWWDFAALRAKDVMVDSILA